MATVFAGTRLNGTSTLPGVLFSESESMHLLVLNQHADPLI